MEKEGDEDVEDILTAAASFSGFFVLDTEDDVIVSVSCVDILDVWNPGLSRRVEDDRELSSVATEPGFDWLVCVSVLY